MEKRIGLDRNLNRYLGEAPSVQGPTFGSPRNHPLYQYSPQPSIQNPPLFVNTHPDQTLESAFSRLGLSSYPQQPSLGALYRGIGIGGGIGDGWLPANLENNGYTVGAEALWSPLPNNDVSPFLGLEDYGLQYDNWKRNEYWNQMLQQRNGLLRDSGFVSNTPSPRSNLQNKLLQQQSLSFEGLRGRIVSLAMDQYGCRLLQIKFEGILSEEEINMIFSEVIDCVGELMLHQFGNYLVQKLVEICDEEQRTQILLEVTKTKYQLVSICLNTHGTRAVQKLLEHLSTPQQVSLVMSALSTAAVTLMKDMNGHHVIQRCLKHFSSEDNKYLLNEVAENLFSIATDKSGCCVLQSCVEHSQGEVREHLVAEITANALVLAEDRYGNYVVQHLIGLRIPRFTSNLLRQLEGNYFSLSCSKYGSNVVEKCLIESGEEYCRQIIFELIRSPNFSMLLLDPYGNYVIQSALTVSKGLVHNNLINLIQENSQSMRSNLYGKKVLAWFGKKKTRNVYRNVQF